MIQNVKVPAFEPKSGVHIEVTESDFQKDAEDTEGDTKNELLNKLADYCEFRLYEVCSGACA